MESEVITAPDKGGIRMVQYQAPAELTLLSPAEVALHEAQELTVDSIAMRDIAMAEMNLNKGIIRKYESDQKELTGDLRKHLEKLVALWRRPKELREATVKVLEQKIIAFNQAEERKRRAEEERLAAAARAEQERVRAEAARVAAKAEQEARELREKAEAARAAGNAGEAAKLEVRAEAKQEAGETRAAVLNEMAASAPTAIVLPAAPKMAGAHETARWEVEEDIDMPALVAFVAANPMYLNLLVPNRTALTALARSLKEAFAIPGVTARQKVGLTRSRAA